MEYKHTLQLSWKNVAAMISLEICSITGAHYRCHINLEDNDYWDVVLTEDRLSLQDMMALLDAVEAPFTARSETLPQDDKSSRCLGMELSTLLLKRYLGTEWLRCFVDCDGLYLVMEEQPERLLTLGRLQLPADALKGRQELLEYLRQNGPTHSSLMDFCEPYREQYHNELCWPYPISDGKHLGTFLILVREGVLSLPYDEAGKENYELFCLEDARMCDSDALAIFLSDWKRFTLDLENTISEMMRYTVWQEQKEDRHEEQH